MKIVLQPKHSVYLKQNFNGIANRTARFFQKNTNQIIASKHEKNRHPVSHQLHNSTKPIRDFFDFLSLFLFVLS